MFHVYFSLYIYFELLLKRYFVCKNNLGMYAPRVKNIEVHITKVCKLNLFLQKNMKALLNILYVSTLNLIHFIPASLESYSAVKNCSVFSHFCKSSMIFFSEYKVYFPIESSYEAIANYICSITTIS